MLRKIFFIFFIFTSNIFAETKNIAYIDLDLIITKSNSGKFLIEQLNTVEKKNIDDFKNQEKNLKEEENSIMQKQNIITEDELKKNILQLKKKINIYKEKKKNFLNKFKIKQNNEILRFINLVSPIIETYMKEESIDMLFDKKNLFIANIDLDVTDEIIVLINKKIDNFNLN